MFSDKLVDVTIVGRNRQHYKNLGYESVVGEVIHVKPQDLPERSHLNESRICDVCGKEYTRQHNWNHVSFQAWHKDVCPECVKSKEFKAKKQEKMSKTSIERYGHPFALQNKEVQAKMSNTIMERYGVPFAAQSEKIKAKIAKTNLEKYGCANPASNPEIYAKTIKTRSQNGDVPVSKQQEQIYQMLQKEMPEYTFDHNVPLSKLSLDIIAIMPNGIKVDIEYDGSHWHQDADKDRRRDEVVKNNGYKVLRIKSGHKIPTIEQL